MLCTFTTLAFENKSSDSDFFNNFELHQNAKIYLGNGFDLINFNTKSAPAVIVDSETVNAIPFLSHLEISGMDGLGE